LTRSATFEIITPFFGALSWEFGESHDPLMETHASFMIVESQAQVLEISEFEIS
jgi:hypothetical protein